MNSDESAVCVELHIVEESEQETYVDLTTAKMTDAEFPVHAASSPRNTEYPHARAYFRSGSRL